MENILSQAATNHLGHMGKMISASKSSYREKYPKNLVIFNSNVCAENEKIWFGDLDITLSRESLSALAKNIEKPVYVLYEIDGRFEYENKPLIEKFVMKFYPDGKEEISKRLSGRIVPSSLELILE